MESFLPETAYLTKKDSAGNSNIGYPGSQTAATAAEVAARAELGTRNSVSANTGGSITLAR